MDSVTFVDQVTVIPTVWLQAINDCVYTGLDKNLTPTTIKSHLHEAPGAIGSVTPSTGAFTSITYTLGVTSRTAFATPSALSATQSTLFASTVSGAAVMGYGTTNDVSLMNRAGTVCLGVGPNTTVVNIPARLTVGTTLAVTGKITATTAGIDVPVSALGTCYSATYTPTVTGITNVDSTVARLCNYVRIGNYVLVTGQCDIDPTATGATAFDVSLPVASNIGTVYQLGGSGSTDNTASQGVFFQGNTTDDRAAAGWLASSLALQTVTFTFGYVVI